MRFADVSKYLCYIFFSTVEGSTLKASQSYVRVQIFITDVG